jgi:hypothetical protein
MKIQLLAIAFLLFSHISYAQENTYEKPRFLGLGASLQAGSFEIALPMWIGADMVVAPYIGLLHASTISTDLRFGLNIRNYFKIGKVAPFGGVRVGVLGNFPSSDLEPSKVDLLGGVGFGIDYFFDPKFSIGVEAQGNFTKSADNSMRFGNPGNYNFNTGTAVVATVYF